MSHYNQQQHPVGVPPPQGYPTKDEYPPQGYPPQYSQPPLITITRALAPPACFKDGYENSTGERETAAGGDSSSGGNVGEGSRGNSQTPRSVERRVRISLPFSFSVLGSGIGIDDDAFGFNNRNNDGGSNSAGSQNQQFQQNRGCGPQPRQDDLD